MKSNILVTGATGFLGAKVVENLIEEENVNRIIASGRTINRHPKIIHPKVTYTLGDLSDSEFTSALCDDIDVVVNCASLCSPWGNYDAFYTANVVSQQNLLSASEQSSVSRFIYISTPSIYINGKSRLDVKESDPLPDTLVNHYADTKLQAERLLLQTSIPYIILRPRAIIGAGDTTIMPRLMIAQQKNRLKIIGSGSNVVNLTSVLNVVHAIKLAMRAPLDSCGEAYNITNDESVRLWDMIALTLNKIGLPVPDKKIKYRTAYFVASILEASARLFNPKKEPALLTYSVNALANSFTLNIDKAKDKLGYNQIQTTEQAIEEFADWYLSNKEL